MNLQSTMKYRKARTNEEQWTALYCRMSCGDDLQGDSNSIRNQKMLLKQYADEHCLHNIKFYVDNERISTAIVKDMLRFGRDYILVGYYTKYYFAEADVQFIAVYDQVDSETNSDDDITFFKNILNEMYAKDYSKKIRQGRRRPNPMGEMNAFSGMLYCADCGKRMYLCRCSTPKQSEYFNCSSYRKQLKRTCSSHQITVKVVETLLLKDLRMTIRFAKSQKQTFLLLLQSNANEKNKRELKESLKELSVAEERIKALDKIIQSLYEDKVAGKISEER